MRTKVSPHHFAIELPGEITDSIQNQPVVADVRQLFLEGRYEELSAVPVCVDRFGKVICRLGDLVWPMWPYHPIPGPDELTELNFSYLSVSPELLLEMEMLHYVWLRVRGSASRKKRIKTATLFGRFTHMSVPLSYLRAKNRHSMAELCDADNWVGFKIFLAGCKLGYGTLCQILDALRAVACVAEHLPFPFRLPPFEERELSRELAAEGREEAIQTFSIPPRLAYLIYGEALAMVEFAWPHRERIAELVQQRHDILRKAKDPAIIDSASSPKGCPTGELTGAGQDTCSEECRSAITAQETHLSEINGELLLLTGNQPPARLLTACFISTGAFTGLRYCEAYQLQPGCYATRRVAGMTFHVLLAATTKPVDGLRPDQWICSPGAGKAVELAEALSRSSRNELLAVAETRKQAGDRGEAEKLTRDANCLWLEQSDDNIPKVANMKIKVHRFAKTIGATVTEEDVAEFRLVNGKAPASLVPQVGQIWPLSCQQMRRTFPVVATRYSLAGIPALKRQYKHRSARTTERYCNGASEAMSADARRDPKLMAVVSGSRIKDQATKPQQLYNDDEQPAGHQHPSNGFRCETEGVVITIEHAPNSQAFHTAPVRNPERLSDNQRERV